MSNSKGIQSGFRPEPVAEDIQCSEADYKLDTIGSLYLRGMPGMQFFYLKGHRNFQKGSPDYGWSWPSLATMALEFNVSKQAISKRIKKLVAAGWIVRRRRGRGYAYKCQIPAVYLQAYQGQLLEVDLVRGAAKNEVNPQRLTNSKPPEVDSRSTPGGSPKNKIKNKMNNGAAPGNPGPLRTDLPDLIPPVEPDLQPEDQVQLDLFAYRPPEEPESESRDQPDLFAYQPPVEPEPVPVPATATVPDDPEFPDEDFPEEPVPVLKPQARRGTAGRITCAGTLKNLSRGLRKRLPGSRGAVLAAYQGEQDGRPLFDARGLDYTRSRVLQQLCPTAIITRPGRETE